MTRFSLSCLTLALGCFAAQAQEPSKDAVKKLALEMGQATIDGDYTKVIDNTHPASVKLLGGREKAIETIEALMKQIKDKGFVITKYEIGDPGEFYTEGDNTFIVLPTKLEMTFPKGKILSKSYLLGISSDKAKTWGFIDGAGLEGKGKEVRDKLLPKMPALLKLPEKSEPEIIRNKK